MAVMWTAQLACPSDDCLPLCGLKEIHSSSLCQICAPVKVFTTQQRNRQKCCLLWGHCRYKSILSIRLLLFPWVRYGKPPHKPPLLDASWMRASRLLQTSHQKYSHQHSWRSLQSVKTRVKNVSIRKPIWLNQGQGQGQITVRLMLIFISLSSNFTVVTTRQRNT